MEKKTTALGTVNNEVDFCKVYDMGTDRENSSGKPDFLFLPFRKAGIFFKTVWSRGKGSLHLPDSR